LANAPRTPEPASSPADPLTSLAESAIHAHEMLTAYVDAGFTRAEALQVIIGIFTAGIRKNSD
jgi:hypothetical protein